LEEKNERKMAAFPESEDNFEMTVQRGVFGSEYDYEDEKEDDRQFESRPGCWIAVFFS
jgi:hypothetical protein